MFLSANVSKWLLIIGRLCWKFLDKLNIRLSVCGGNRKSRFGFGCTDLEGSVSFTDHKSLYLLGLSAIRIAVRNRNLNSSRCWVQSPRDIPYEMSEAAPANQMAPVHSEQWNNWVHLSAINLGVNQPSPQLSLRSRRQVARGRFSAQGTQLPRWPHQVAKGSRRPGRPRHR